MSTPSFPELASLRTGVSADAVAEHLDAIDAALVVAGPIVVAPAWWRRWRRRLAGLLVGVGVLVPGGALASDSAVPGDLLYPVKQLLEPLVALVDDDVVAEHRIEELEKLVERDDSGDAARIETLFDEARDALDRRDSPSLEARLDALGDRPPSTPDGDRVPADDPDGDAERPDVDAEVDRPPRAEPTPTPMVEPTPTPDRADDSPPDDQRTDAGVAPDRSEPEVEPTPSEPVRDPAPTPTAAARDRAEPTPTSRPEPTPTPGDRGDRRDG